MAKSINVQVLNDGYRNATIKIDGYVNGEDYTNYTIVTASALGDIDAIHTKASQVRVNRINFDIEDVLQCDLIWGGGTPSSLWRATGRGEIKAKPFGGIVTNAVSPDGTILLTTEGGATATSNLSFTIILELVKY